MNYLNFYKPFVLSVLPPSDNSIAVNNNNNKSYIMKYGYYTETSAMEMSAVYSVVMRFSKY
jgi:hypothetical protein